MQKIRKISGFDRYISGKHLFLYVFFCASSRGAKNPYLSHVPMEESYKLFCYKKVFVGEFVHLFTSHPVVQALAREWRG